MALVSISQAAKLAGIARSQLAELTQTIKLLEHKPEPKAHQWWKFWH